MTFLCLTSPLCWQPTPPRRELRDPHPGRSWKIPSGTHYVCSQGNQIVFHLSLTQGWELRAILLPVAKPQQVIKHAGSVSSLPQSQARWPPKQLLPHPWMSFPLNTMQDPPWNSCHGTPPVQYLTQRLRRIPFVLSHQLLLLSTSQEDYQCWWARSRDCIMKQET